MLGPTVDAVAAAMEVNHLHLMTQKALYVEIGRARDCAELVTAERNALCERLETATDKHIAALKAVDPERTKTLKPRAGAAHDI